MKFLFCLYPVLQHPLLIPRAAQLVMAGNDSVGLRYGTTETPDRFYQEWKEDTDQESIDDWFEAETKELLY